MKTFESCILQTRQSMLSQVMKYSSVEVTFSQYLKHTITYIPPKDIARSDITR